MKIDVKSETKIISAHSEIFIIQIQIVSFVIILNSGAKQRLRTLAHNFVLNVIPS